MRSQPFMSRISPKATPLIDPTLLWWLLQVLTEQPDLLIVISGLAVNSWPFHPPKLKVTYLSRLWKGHQYASNHPKKVTFSRRIARRIFEMHIFLGNPRIFWLGKKPHHLHVLLESLTCEMDLLGAGGCACELWGFFNPFWPVNVGINYQPTSLTGESYRISEPSTVSNVYVMSLWFIIPILPGVVIFIPDKKTMPSTVVPFHSFFPHQFWVVLRIPRHSFWYAPFRSAKSSYPWRGISDGGEIALVVSLDGWKSWWTYQKAGGFKCKMKDFRFVYIYMYIYIHSLKLT